MSNFDYDAGAPTSTDRLRHFLSLSGAGRQTHAGVFTLETGVTGTLDITGCGFDPECVLIFGTVQAPGEEFQDHGALHIGGAAGSDQWAGGIYLSYLTGLSPQSSVWKDDKVISAMWTSAIDMEAEFDSWITDGFRIDVTDDPAIDVDCAYLAMAGEGAYAVGTAQGNTATGTQAITGLGFQPQAIFFASTSRPTLADGTDYARMMLGGADANGQYAVWAGSKSGDPYNDNETYMDCCVLFLEDSDGGGPFQPTTQAEGVLDSLDADGFTLDWVVADGTGRHFSWMAFENAEVGRWVFNNSLNKPVATTAASEGLIFFCNNRHTDWRDQGHNPPGGTYGFSLGLGVCDQLLNQWAASTGQGDAPPFSQFQAVRELVAGLAFGSYGVITDGVVGTMPNNMQDTGAITDLGAVEEAFIPQIYRRVLLPQ